MSDVCTRAQEALAEGGVAALGLAQREHVVDCAACSDLLLALNALDTDLGEWEAPPLPAGLNERVAAAVAAEPLDELELEMEPAEEAPARGFFARRRAAKPSDDPSNATPPPLRRWPISTTVVAAAALLMLAAGTFAMQFGGKVKGLFETADAEIDSVDSNLGEGWRPGRSSRSPAAAAPAEEAPVVADAGGGDAFAGRLNRSSDEWKAMDPDGDGMRRPTSDLSGKNFGDVFRPQVRRKIQTRRNKSDSITITTPSRGSRRRGEGRAPAASPAPPPEAPRQAKKERGGLTFSLDEGPSPEPSVVEEQEEEAIFEPEPVPMAERVVAKTPQRSAPADSSLSLRTIEGADEQLPATLEEKRRAVPLGYAEDIPADKDRDRSRLGKQAAEKGLLALIGTTGDTSNSALSDLLADADGLAADVGEALARQAGAPIGGRYPGADGKLDLEALRWLEEGSALDVPTVPAAGYWSNTYVPGDPALRRLESRVRGQREHRLARGLEADALDAAAHQVRQPFDAPTDGALGVYLHADRRGITEPTRMRIQVGLQGTERRSGRRPAMNVGVVLDLRGQGSARDEGAMRALVEALVQARDLGDTFSLTVAGRPGGAVVPAQQFRYGPVRLALESLFGGTPTEGPTLGLQAAMLQAVAAVGATDDPNRPLGSSVVLLVSPRDLLEDAPALEAIAHRSAVAGIPVSVVGVGADADHVRLEAIALAGQGNRRVLTDASDADSVVDRELSAASQVVARAVRLRIRLAPGVKLVDVLGSHNLDAAQSQQVRQAEQSIDRRLARNLGIQADRGDDEEGIQIVIPTWYAGDGHAVLLDVIAPGPGPIADVSVKYKDLVRLNNGVARASLHLGRDPRPPGPLELNVVKNEVAHELSVRLAEAADRAAGGRSADGAQVVRDARTWLGSVQRAVPALRGDRELQRDLSLLTAYAHALDASSGADSNQYLHDSLRLAARRKVLAPLAEDSEGAP